MKKINWVLVLFLAFGFFVATAPAQAQVSADLQNQEQLALLSNYFSSLQKLLLSLQNLLTPSIVLAQTAPPVPTITQPAAGGTVSSTVTVAWSGAASPYVYTLWRNNAPISGCIDLPYTTTQCTDTGASGSVNYGLAVCSGPNNAAPCSGASVTVTVGVSTPQPPAAPTSLTTSYAVTSEIGLVYGTWTDNANDETSFELYRKPSTASTFSFVSNYGAKTVSAPSAVQSNDPNGNLAAGSYDYEVRACNANGCSAYSNISTVTVPAASDTQAPSTPTGLVSTRDNYNEVDLNWIGSTDNVGVAGYYVWRSYNGIWGQIGQTTASSFMDLSVAVSSPYYYAVVAYDTAGNKSATSTNLFLNTPAGSGFSTSTVSGACELRGPNASVPSYSAANVGYQYAKVHKSGINDIAGLRSACVTPDFSR